MIKFHKHKEKEMELLREKIFAEKKPENEELFDANLALVTVMGAEIEPEKNKYYGYFTMNDNTFEMLHYAENSENRISNMINCGIYVFSVRIFQEYGLNVCPDD
jgi:NDP-sugar pyrophosphorylase family protein